MAFHCFLLILSWPISGISISLFEFQDHSLIKKSHSIFRKSFLQIQTFVTMDLLILEVVYGKLGLSDSITYIRLQSLNENKFKYLRFYLFYFPHVLCMSHIFFFIHASFLDNWPVSLLQTFVGMSQFGMSKFSTKFYQKPE